MYNFSLSSDFSKRLADYRMAESTTSKNGDILLATGGYDHTIKLWQAHSGMCSKTLQHADSVSFNIMY